MGLTTTSNRSAYAGDDATTVFSFPNKFLLDADLVVLITDALGVITTQTITTHYTVSGAGEDAGGSVTMITPPATGETLTIYRDPSPTQDLDLSENDSAPAEAQETAYDKLTMLVQRLIEIDERSISLADGYVGSFDLTLPTTLTADEVLGVNTGGTAWEMKSADDLMSLAGALLVANNLSDVASVPTTLTNLGIDGYDARITTNATDIGTNTTDIGTINTTLSGGSGDVVWTTKTQTLSAKTFSDQILGADGTVSLPSYTFSGDVNTGMYRATTDTIGFTAGGMLGLQVKKSTGSYANIGMGGGNASVSDSFPLLVERSLAAGINVQFSNPNGGASAVSKFVFKAGVGAISTGEIALWPTAQTLHAYQNRLVIRSSDTAAGVSIIGSGSADDDVRIYNGGVASTDESVRFNADKSMQFMQEIATPANPATNTHKVYFKSDGLPYRLNDAGDEIEFGSGSSSGGSINHISNSDFETNLDGWSTYKDAAATTPVDGTGGTATSTLTLTTASTEIVRGSQSVEFIKPNGSNQQGEGFSYDLSIDPADTYKNLITKFEYKTGGALYTSGDLKVFVYDIDNATLIGAVSNDDDGDILSFTSTDSATGFVGTFTATDSLNYRLISHVTTTTTSGFFLQADNMSLGPDTFGPGFIGTSWESYTSTLTNVTGTESFKFKRNGDSVDIEGSIDFTGAATGVIAFTLPSGLELDASKLGNGILSTDAYQDVGRVMARDASPAGYWNGVILRNNTSLTEFVIVAAGGSAAGGSATWDATTPFTWANTDNIAIDIKALPIVGWASSNLVSTTEADYSIVKARYTSASTSAVPDSTTVFDFGTVDYDTHNSVTTGASWKFTAPRRGYYYARAHVNYTAHSSASRYDTALRVNGVAQSTKFDTYSAANVENSAIDETLFLEKGDYIDFVHHETVNGGTYVSTSHSISITEMPDFKTFGVYKVDELKVQEATTANYTITAGQWGDLAQEDLGIGEYDILITTNYNSNGATTTGNVYCALGDTSGNNAPFTDLATIDYSLVTKNTATGTFDQVIFSKKGFVVTTAATYYLKALAQTSITNLQVGYKMEIRRVK